MADLSPGQVARFDQALAGANAHLDNLLAAVRRDEAERGRDEAERGLALALALIVNRRASNALLLAAVLRLTRRPETEERA